MATIMEMNSDSLAASYIQSLLSFSNEPPHVLYVSLSELGSNQGPCGYVSLDSFNVQYPPTPSIQFPLGYWLFFPNQLSCV